MLIDINGLDELHPHRLLINLSSEIEPNELVVGRVESKPWKGELIVIDLRLTKHVCQQLWRRGKKKKEEVRERERVVGKLEVEEIEIYRVTMEGEVGF